jgi:two-component sensor histidine kinase
LPPTFKNWSNILSRGWAGPQRAVRFRFDLQPCQLPIDLAIPCGMIVNELVSNALEHAFPQGPSGTIRVAFASDAAGYRLTVADDGVGLPEGLDPGKQGALGLKVVQP